MSDEFGKSQAQELIQSKLADVMRTLHDEVIPIANKYEIEFEFLGMRYRMLPRYSPETMQVWDKESETWVTVPRPPAKEGLLVSDDEWESSSFGCSGRYWDWYMKQWPEKDE